MFGEGRGTLGGHSLCLVRTGSLKEGPCLRRGLRDAPLTQERQLDRAFARGALRRADPQQGKQGTLSKKEGGGHPVMGPGASAASTRQGTLKNGVKCHEGSVRCEHSRFHVSLGTAPEKRRHTKNMRLPDPLMSGK